MGSQAGLRERKCAGDGTAGSGVERRDPALRRKHPLRPIPIGVHAGAEAGFLHALYVPRKRLP